jgi:hypothetical protein
MIIAEVAWPWHCGTATEWYAAPDEVMASVWAEAYARVFIIQGFSATITVYNFTTGVDVTWQPEGAHHAEED